jgi:hypothetical protein
MQITGPSTTTRLSTASNVGVPGTWTMLEGFNNDNPSGTSNLMSYYLNGMLLASTAANTGTTTYTSNLYLNGRNNTNLLSFNLYVGELLIYNRALTPSERFQVERYLANKWNLPLGFPLSHPYYLSRVLPSTPLFTPANFSNLGLWLDAGDSSTISLSPGTSNVSQWSDKSGNSRHATGITSKWTTYVPGTNYVQFTAANNSVLDCPGMSLVVNTQYTIFTVYRRDNPPTNPVHPGIQFFCGGSSSTTDQRLHIGYVSYTSMKFAQWANDNLVTVPGLASPEPTNVWGFTQTASQRIMYLNGTIPAGGTNTNSTLITANPGGVIGAYQADPFYSLDGRLHEFIVFTRALSTREREQMEGYLAWKYGAQNNLPTTHPYYKFRP